MTMSSEGVSNVTLLDLYNFHLASSPQSPVASSFLNAYSPGSSRVRLGAGSLRTASPLAGAAAGSAAAAKPFSIPKRSNFLCCGVTFRTFADLARHYERTHSDNAEPEPEHEHEHEPHGIAIPAKQPTPATSADADADAAAAPNQQSLVSLSDLLSFPDFAFEPVANAKPKLPSPAETISVLPVQPPAPSVLAAGAGKSQLSLGLSKQATPPPTDNSPTQPPSSIFRNLNSADQMFSNPSDDIDATLSALLSSDQPHFNLERPPITTTTNTTNIGHAIMAANKRTLSSAAFSLGSYTAADLKKLRTDFNYSGIDLDWLMGDSSSDAKEGGGVGTANGAKNRPIAEPTRRVPVSMGAPLVFPSAQLQQQYQQQEQNHQQLFQSMAIPAHIGELARPIAIDTLTPENYLRMLLEAHHLVGQAHSYLGARDYQAVAHDLIASGVRPQDLTNAQLSQIVQGIQQIDLGTTGNVTSGMPGGNPTNPVSAIPPAQHATNLFGNQLGMFQQQQPQQHQQQLQHRLIQEPISANTHQPPQPNPPKIITCPHCSKQYKSHSGFKYHMEHQHPLESSSSKQQHNSSNDLLFSKQIPPASPSLNLPFSSLGFSSPTALQQLDDPNSLFGSDGLPKRQIHPSQLNKPFKCSVAGCLKSYKNKGGLKYHVEHEHPETL